MTQPRTLGDLKNSPWAEPPLRGRTVRDEIRTNLLARLAAGGPLFPGHRRLRGHGHAADRQRAARAAQLHPARPARPGQEPDPARADRRCSTSAIPIVAGSEVNDDPFAPISKYARERLARVRRRHADRLARPRPALRREARDARRHHRRHHRRRRSDQGGARRTPAVRRADDALRPAAARQPRHLRASTSCRISAARCRSACSTSCRKATSRSKAIRCACRSTCCSCFTANPEDYTARGKIITPLKDRIGSRDHHALPAHRGARHGDHGAGGVDRPRRPAARHPRLHARGGRADRVRGARGQARRQALGRDPAHADQRAGERGLQRRAARDRCWARSGSCRASSDVYAAVPSITGKIELEYEGELQGGDIDRARADPPRGGQGARGADGRRRPRQDRRLVRPGRRAQGAGRRAGRALLPGIQRGARAARHGGRVRALAPSRTTRAPWPPASWCSRASPPRSGSAGARSWATPG